ncbi:MAG: hypothetical protein GF310_00445 [candidate division Zixibacteria bacterium]|nr:hypothetical protein [candidate division Zixibacteria bacterium]
MKSIILLFLIILLLSSALIADDLYLVELENHNQAQTLILSKTDPVLRMGNQYLILADKSEIQVIKNSGIKAEIVASVTRLEELALDQAYDDRNLKKFEKLYENDGLRILSVPPEELTHADEAPTLLPLKDRKVRVKYMPPIMAIR